MDLHLLWGRVSANPRSAWDRFRGGVSGPAGKVLAPSLVHISGTKDDEKKHGMRSRGATAAIEKLLK